MKYKVDEMRVDRDLFLELKEKCKNTQLYNAYNIDDFIDIYNDICSLVVEDVDRYYFEEDMLIAKANDKKDVAIPSHNVLAL